VVFPVRLPGWALVGTYFVLQYVLYISMPPSTGGEGSVAYAALPRGERSATTTPRCTSATSRP